PSSTLFPYTTLFRSELDVDFLLTTNPTATFKGKLARNKISSEATPNRDANNEAEPMALAWMRNSPKKDANGKYDIPEESLLPVRSEEHTSELQSLRH